MLLEVPCTNEGLRYYSFKVYACARMIHEAFGVRKKTAGTSDATEAKASRPRSPAPDTESQRVQVLLCDIV